MGITRAGNFQEHIANGFIAFGNAGVGSLTVNGAAQHGYSGVGPLKFRAGTNGGEGSVVVADGSRLDLSAQSLNIGVGVSGADGLISYQSGSAGTYTAIQDLWFYGSDRGGGGRLVVSQSSLEMISNYGTAGMQLGDQGPSTSWGVVEVLDGSTFSLRSEGGAGDSARLNLSVRGEANSAFRVVDSAATIVGANGADARVSVSFAQGVGLIDVSNSAFEVTSDGGNAGLTLGVGHTAHMNVSQAASVTISGAAAELIVGRESGSDGTLTISGGSQVSVAGSGSDAGTTGTVFVASSHDDAQGAIVIDGPGSILSATGNVIVGRVEVENAGGAVVALSNGGTLEANEIAVREDGQLMIGTGTVRATHPASGFILNGIDLKGAMTLAPAGTATLEGEVAVHSSAEIVFQVAPDGSSAGRMVHSGARFAFEGQHSFTIEPGVYRFTAGDTYELFRSDGRFCDFYNRTLSGPPDLSIQGQGAGFGYAVVTGEDGNDTVIDFLALNDGSGNEPARLDFDPASQMPAEVDLQMYAYDAAVKVEGRGGMFGDAQVQAFNVDAVEGTAAGDVFNASGSNVDLSIDIYGRGGDDVFDESGMRRGLRDGGAGSDTIKMLAFDAVHVNLESGTIDGAVRLVSVENARGGLSDDVLVGSGKANRLDGWRGDDALEGAGGNDLLIGGYGADHLDGGSGRDTALYDGAATAVVVDLADMSRNRGDAAGDTFTSIEIVAGTRFGDDLLGDGAVNELQGRGGDDTLEGRAGNDVLRGGDGNDRLFGGDQNDILFGDGGADLLNGGRGFDFVSYTASTSGIVIDAMDAAANAGDAAGDRLQLIENLVGSNHDDTVLGGNVANVLLGRGGDDVIDGRGGADLIDGGGGADTLTGGQGFDTFRYRWVQESTIDRRDDILDFDRRFDLIDLSGIDADTGAAGEQAFTFIGQGVDFTGTAGELRYSEGLVQADLDGDAEADLAIGMNGVATMSADDFVL